MANLPIRWIEARTYCHSTEEPDRVDRAIAFACPAGETTTEALEGHFGNALLRLRRRVEDGQTIRVVWETWSAAGLPAAIRHDLEARVDEDGILHFRLDKQAAFRGHLALAPDQDAIDVRLKLMAFPAKPEEARRVARTILSEAL